MAHGSADAIAVCEAGHACQVVRLPSHSTSARCCRHRNVVVETDRDRLDERRRDRGDQRRGDRKGHRWHRRQSPAASTTRARPPPRRRRQRRQAFRATDLSGFQGKRRTETPGSPVSSLPRLVGLSSRRARAGQTPSNQRRGAVTEREDSPRRSHDVETRPENEVSSKTETDRAGYREESRVRDRPDDTTAGHQPAAAARG